MKHLRLPVILGFVFAAFLFAACSGNVETDGIKTDVSQNATTYTVTVARGILNGSITVDKTTGIKAGETVTLTVTPSTGYKLENLKVTKDTGVTVTTTIDATDSKKYTFTMPDTNVTVKATFTTQSSVNNPVIVTYSVTVADGIANGSVTVNKTTGIIQGETVTLTVIPSTGYELQTLAVTTASGTTVTSTGDTNDSTKFTFTMPASNVTVTASFVLPLPSTYTVTVANGSVTADKTTDITAGETITLTVTPSDDFEFETLSVTAASGAAVATSVDANDETIYTFTMPASNVNVTASFIYHFHNTVTKTGTKTINGTVYDLVYFGDFPQTILDSTEVSVDETTSMTIGGFTYYKGSDNYWYVKCIENGYISTGYTTYYSNRTKVCSRSQDNPKYLFFKVEPIQWRVLKKNSDGTALLLAEKTLTAFVPYYDYLKNDPIVMYRTLNENTIYPNNYKYSNIRAYLNGTKNQFVLDGGTASLAEEDWTGIGFLQSAFTTAAQSLIKDTAVDNGEDSTTDTSGVITKASNYYCDNTTDKIFLLSVYEATKSDYGFAGCDNQDSARVRLSTDYAKANYAFQNNTDPQATRWMLRSPVSTGNANAKSIDDNGKANGNYSAYLVGHSGKKNSGKYGVVPALTAIYGN